MNGQKQWGRGGVAGREIRPVRKPEKGVLEDAQGGCLEKTLSGEDGTWKSYGSGSVAVDVRVVVGGREHGDWLGAGLVSLLLETPQENTVV